MSDSQRLDAASRALRETLDGSVRLAWASLDGLVWVAALGTASAFRDLYVPTQVPVLALGLSAALAAALHLTFGSLIGAYRRSQIGGSYEEVLDLTRSALMVVGCLTMLSWVLAPRRWAAPVSVVVVGGLVALISMLASRLVVRSYRLRRLHTNGGKPAIIFGAGSGGRLLVHNLHHDAESPYQPVAFIDDDPRKRSWSFEGVRVYGGRDRLAAVAARLGAEHLVIAIPSADAATMRDIRAAAEAAGLRTLVAPRLVTMLHGKVRGSDIRDIDLEDLLGRRPVALDEEAIAAQIVGKRVLVTGAGGSIGSELCRQIARYGPSRLVMLDRDESGLHALELSLFGTGLLDGDATVLADIRDPAALHAVFETHQPQVVFHAAALKHLPLLQRYPMEAWQSNVLGTLNVLRAAADVGVDAFVNISTDKAAEPTSVLGYSKRIAERLTADFAERCEGTYISVRFGNVLGSRGSVIHTFTSQIAQGGPVTVTHPDVERYFMLIPEACQLVLQSVALGEHSEVLVLDMGQPVRIADVARTLIDLSERDVSLTYTGLRPGEKMTEDLIGDREDRLATKHPLITRVAVPGLDEPALSASAVDKGSCLGTMARLALGDQTIAPFRTRHASVRRGVPAERCVAVERDRGVAHPDGNVVQQGAR